jgi:hypothetical protein
VRYIPVRLIILAVAILLLVGIVAAGAVREAVEDWSAGPSPADDGSAVPPAGAGTVGVQHPIDHYTPGAVAPGVTFEDLCPHLSVLWDRARRSLSDGQRVRVKALYGIPAETKVSEWDHLIPRELAGADTQANIWPMVNHDQDQRKDRLENELHRQVCAGRLDLGEAQERALRYWLWWT